MPKMQPAETVLNYVIGPGVQYLDINHDLSLLNRRAFRQGTEIYMTIELFGSSSATNPAEMSVFRAPRSWVACNAWTMAFNEWKDQQSDVIDETGSQSVEGKYNDFKIYLDDEMVTGSIVKPTMAPLGSLALAIDPDSLTDWDYSQFVVPNDGGVVGATVEYHGHLLGADVATSKGLVHAYAQRRARPFPFDPSTVAVVGPSSGGLYEEMEDVGMDSGEILDNVRYENNAAPYVIGGANSIFEFYPGGAEELASLVSGWDATANRGLVHEDTLIVRAGSTISTDVTRPFSALCGLVRLHNSGDDIFNIKVRVMPGPHKGITALPMQDVN